MLSTIQNYYYNYNLQLTIVDGQVCSALSETFNCKCYIFDAKPSEINDLEKYLNKKAHKLQCNNN